MLKKLFVSSLVLALLMSVAPGAVLAKKGTEAQTRKVEQTEKTRPNILMRELRQGMSGEEITALQELLAANPDVYPEGLVTGFYGPMTAKAVMKFQQKYGLDSVGLVGPKTRAKLNELANTPDVACRAWGHRIAPGQLKRVIGTTTIDLSGCAKVPKGISDKLNGDWHTGSTTASTTLKISNIRVNDITADEATVKWTTNALASTTVWYSTDSDVDLNDAEEETSTSLTKTHEVTLEDLEEATDYYFVITATDATGRTATSSVRDFETKN